MSRGRNRLDHCKCILHLLVAVLFFISSHISLAISDIKGPPPQQDPLKDGKRPTSGYEELLMAKTMLLSPSVSEMSEALKPLQKEYPRQIIFWQELKSQLLEGDPAKNEIETYLDQAHLIFPSIIAYSDRFAEEQRIIEKALVKRTSLPRDSMIQYYTRLIQLLHLREKLLFFEAGSQGIFTNLFQTLSKRWNQPAGEALKKANAFEKLRKSQMAKYLKARQDFDRVRFLVLQIEQPINLRMRLWMWGNIDVCTTLMDELAHSVARKDTSSVAVGDGWNKSIAEELAQISRQRVQEIKAMDGVFAQDHRESLWSILYSPPIADERSNPPLPQDFPQIQMSNRLIRSLEAMHPRLKTLVQILNERNRLLHTIPLLKTDLFDHLRNQLALEESSLNRLKDVLDMIEKYKKRPDEIIRDMKFSALYEECGFLKEQLLTLETLLLNELRILIQSTPLPLDSRWPQVQALLREQDLWKKSWQSYESDWKLLIKRFGHYQEDVLRRYASGLHELNQNMEYLKRTSNLPIDSMGRQFFNFLENIIKKQLDDTRLAIETKRKMMEFTEEDPLYAYLFGVHPNNFWHMHLGQGPIFYSLERFIAQKYKIMDHLRGLSQEKVNQQQQAFLILQIAKDFGFIQDIGRNQKGYVVVFGSGDHSLVLEGLVLGQPNLYRMPPIQNIRSSWIKINQSVFNFLTPDRAHAGIGDFWNNLKQNWSIREYRDNLFNQCSKNKWNYIVSGALGAVLAIPTGGASLVPFGVQLAADSYIAMTRSVVKAGNPQQWETFNRAIDHVESLYNIGKVVEAAHNIYNRPGLDASLDRARERATEQIRRVGSEAVDKIQQLNGPRTFWNNMADDAANAVINNPRWSNEVKQIIMDLSKINTERVVQIGGEMTDVAQNVTKNVNEIKRTIRTLVSVTGGISRVVQYTLDTIGTIPTAISGGEGLGEMRRDTFDCSRWPGSVPQWNNQTNRMECFCSPGLAWNRDRTMCIDYRQAAIESADCSRWPGSVPMWNNQTNRAECFCPQGMVWNRDRTMCIDARQAALENTDCSRWPGSIPLWNNQTNRAECFCPQGMAWNRDRTMCIDARQAAIESTDCSRWPGSIPLWNNQTNRAECFCPQGMVWNQNRTACISARQQPPPGPGPTPTGPPRQVRCNDTAKQGGNKPETLVVDLGRTSGVFRFDYDMYDVPDRMIVRYGGGTYDTQCTGGKQGRGRDKGSVNLQFFGSSQVTIQVLPACQGGSTSWKFTVHCPK